MTHAFFDDANTYRENGFIFLAGYAADDTGWDAFSQEWGAALYLNGLRRLHTSDFLAGGGEYRRLDLPEPRRWEIIGDFIDIIRRNTVFGFSVGVDARAFETTLAHAKKKASPQHFAFERIVTMTRRRLEQWPGAIPFHMVFDDSEEHSMRFYGALRDIKRKRAEIRESVIGISFCDDRFVMPLQAADLLACATVRESRRGVPDAWSDGPFRNLLLNHRDPAYGKLYESEYWNAEEIERRKDELLIATGNTRGPPNPAAGRGG